MFERYLKRNSIEYTNKFLYTGNIYSWDNEFYPMHEYPCIFIENPTPKLFKYCEKHNITYKFWKFTGNSIYYFMDDKIYEDYSITRKKHEEILENYWQEYHKQLIKKGS